MGYAELTCCRWATDTLLQHSASPEGPVGLDPASAVPEDPIVEDEGEVAVAGDDLDLLADPQGVAPPYAHRRMLRREAGDRTARICREKRRGSVLAESLLADIEDRSFEGRATHHGCQHTERRPVARH